MAEEERVKALAFGARGHPKTRGQGEAIFICGAKLKVPKKERLRHEKQDMKIISITYH